MIGLVSYIVFFLILSLIFGVAVLGLNLQWGFTGLFNAGVAGFTAIGAYTMAILTGPARDAVFGGFELPFVVGLIGAMAASGIGAVVVGLATLKLRHEYLAVATFGIAVTIQLVCLNWEYLTGGTLGLIGIPNPSKAWADGPLAQNALYLLVVLVVVGLTFAALERIVKSPWGRMLKAIREDDVAAASLGKSPERVRLEAFVLGCMIMGLSGALYVSFIGYVSPWDFLPILTFQIWTMLIVGGSANNRGALLGALIVWGVWTMSGFVISRVVPSEIQAQGGAMQAVLIGLILVVTLLIRPRGLIGEELHVSRHARS
ncbi:MAG: branched-chain amino acid ABC transporter permease [Boseongicola sp. SB0673_bin_14]|nr:branched-chain amino acid ABC transporter permease [Boseongicola sp.]MXW84784.1 branched-chain amino acid ABC transporter permease [Boseongicola sp. SB0667_bin_21]MYI68190.1 branched-chain amino acid ABC transporter permease [Boseongicola sp. SB0673_bin_14]